MSDRLTILQGDALERLRELPAESVQCCVTSPPYWGLRDYNVEGQMGLGQTPDEYIAGMVEVFREVRRVLRKDGTLWLNMGDCYASAASGASQSALKALSDLYSPRKNRRANHRSQDKELSVPRATPCGWKAKDLIGMPWRLAFALQADGWWLRCDIIWHKPNPMPESVTDRPTKSHEYIFLLTKNATYFYDAEAVREVNGTEPFSEEYEAIKANGTWKSGGKTQYAGSLKTQPSITHPNGRNKHSVWTVPSAAYAEAHFATYPPELIKPCILAGTSAGGCCSECGAPRERVIEKGQPLEEWRKASGADANGEYHGKNTKDYQGHKAQPASTVKERILKGMVERRTVDWAWTCDCAARAERRALPCVVLDPFLGSGTTAMVALELGRRVVGIELNPEYVKLSERRCDVTPGLAL